MTKKEICKLLEERNYYKEELNDLKGNVSYVESYRALVHDSGTLKDSKRSPPALSPFSTQSNYSFESRTDTSFGNT